jgi:hypothetical protein
VANSRTANSVFGMVQSLLVWTRPGLVRAGETCDS